MGNFDNLFNKRKATAPQTAVPQSVSPTGTPLLPHHEIQAATPPSSFDPQNMIGGIGGMILGGAAGTALGAAGGTAAEPGAGTIAGGITGERIGQTAGGGIGQGLEEFIKELVNHHSLNPAEIARQTAEGTVLGLIPGGKAAKGFLPVLKKAALSAPAGFGIGAATQAIQETGMQGTPQERTGRVLKAGAEMAATLPITEVGLGALRGVGRFFGNKLPTDILDLVVRAPARVAADLYEKAKATLVGDNFVQYFKENNLVPTEGITAQGIKDSLSKTRVKAKEVAETLNGFLKKTGVMVSHADVRTLIEEARNSAETGPRNKNDLAHLLYKEAGISSPYTIGEAELPMNMLDKGKTISLDVFNKVKQKLADFYHIKGIPEVYNKFQTMVETLSGNSEVVKALNREQHTLSMGLRGLKYWAGEEVGRGKPRLWPEEFTPKGIQKAMEEAKKGNPLSLQVVYGGLGILGLVGAMGVTKAITKSMTATIGVGAIGGLGLTFGMKDFVKKAIEMTVEDPSKKEAVAGLLTQAWKTASKMADKLQIQKAIEQLYARKNVPITSPTGTKANQ